MIISCIKCAYPIFKLKLAQALQISEDALTQKQGSPISHSHNQQGGYTNTYFAQNSVEAVLKAKDETVLALKQHIRDLERMLQGKRSEVQWLIPVRNLQPIQAGRETSPERMKIVFDGSRLIQNFYP